MARANRHSIPGYVWHITHRCHKREFLLKFAKDRDTWLRWLFEAKKRYGLKILNYIVTSNHIHLLLFDSGKNEIPKGIQIVAGRTGQEFNNRKKRKGAFWEDRYHATAIDTNQYLIQCMVYIDLNMMRAGVVRHPSEWSWSGYNEIQNPPERYSLINQKVLQQLCGIREDQQLREEHKMWVDMALKRDMIKRESMWSEAVAVGKKQFVEKTKEQLGSTSFGRKLQKKNEGFELRDPTPSYKALFSTEKEPLSQKNTCFWDDKSNISK